MKFLYTTVINALLFYFLVNVFNGIHIAGAGNVLSSVIAGVVFGVLMALVPYLLTFLKLPNTLGAVFLLTLILTFAFLFLLYMQIADLGFITATNINLGGGGGVIKLAGAVQTMVVATIVMAISVIGLAALERRSR